MSCDVLVQARTHLNERTTHRWFGAAHQLTAERHRLALVNDLRLGFRHDGRRDAFLRSRSRLGCCRQQYTMSCDVNKAPFALVLTTCEPEHRTIARTAMSRCQAFSQRHKQNRCTTENRA